MIAKELRALLPLWAAAVCAVLVCGRVRSLYWFSASAYLIGAAALGAFSIGHEYSHRTLPLMLTQPVSRRRMFLTKLAALGAALVTLALVASQTMPLGRNEMLFRYAIVWLPVLAALFITPGLTLVTRSPLAAAVFTMGIVGVLTIAGEWVGVLTYGYTANVDAVRVAFLWRAILVVATAAAVYLWWGVARLELIEGRAAAVDRAPRAVPSSLTLTRGSPVWLLIKKELRLQQLSFAVAALYIVVYLLVLLRTRGQFYQNDAAFVVSILYVGLISILIGSVASAEERHLRTLEVQLLAPMRVSRQWWIKVSVVLGLTLALAIVVPATLAVAFPPERILWARHIQQDVAFSSTLAAFAVASLGLYVSTLCSSGLWALMMSVPAAFAAVTYVNRLASILDSLGGGLRGSMEKWAVTIATAGTIAVVLRLALVNHRWADRSVARTAGQIGVIAASLVVAAAAIYAAGALSR